MSQGYNADYLFIDEIYIGEIAFDNNAEDVGVTIFGYREVLFEEKLQTVDYFCEFSLLTDMLLFAGETADPIITAIANKLQHGVDNPLVVDVENLTGEPFKIDNIILKIYRPKEKDENGNWHETSDSERFYIIEEIEHTETFDRPAISRAPEVRLAEHFMILQNAYQYYLQLLSIGISEKKARQKSGLKDELLFRFALLNNEIIKKNNNEH